MMTVKDIGMMLELMESAYGNAFYKETSREKVVKLWSVMFVDDDPVEVGVAVKDCIATLTFPPRIADIKGRIAQNRLSGQMTEIEAWTLVCKAVDEANSNAEARRQFDNLPPVVQKTIVSPEYLRSLRVIPEEQFQTVTMSQFCRSYRTVIEREASYHALPEDIKKAEAWKIDGAPKPEALPAPEKPKYELPAEWNRNRPVDDSVIDRLSDFTKGEEK